MRRQTREQTITWAKTSLTIISGIEGPEHDPYSFTEYLLKREGEPDFRFHEGLDVWCEAGDPIVRIESSQAWPLSGNLPGSIVRKIFEAQLPIDLKTLHRCIERINSRCKKCGSPLDSVPGFPGETLYMCVNEECGEICGGSFNRSAIE